MKRESDAARDAERDAEDALALVNSREAVLRTTDIFSHILAYGEDTIDVTWLPVLVQYVRGWATTSRATYVALLTNAPLWTSLVISLAKRLHLPLGDFSVDGMPHVSLMRLRMMSMNMNDGLNDFEWLNDICIEGLLATFCPDSRDRGEFHFPFPPFFQVVVYLRDRILRHMAKTDHPIWLVNQRLWHINDPLELFLHVVAVALRHDAREAQEAPELAELYVEIRWYMTYEDDHAGWLYLAWLDSEKDYMEKAPRYSAMIRHYFMTLYEGYMNMPALATYIRASCASVSLQVVRTVIETIQSGDDDFTIVQSDALPASYKLFWFLVYNLAGEKLKSRDFTKDEERMFHAPCTFCRAPTDLFERATQTPLCSPACQDAWHTTRK